MNEFLSYYYSLSLDDKRELRKQIVDACKIEPPTFYSWLQRKEIPELPLSVVLNTMQTFKEQKEPVKIDL